MNAWRGSLLLILLGSGCQASGPDLGFAVALSLRFDNSLSDADLARVTSLTYHATGDEQYNARSALDPAARTERLVYWPLPSTRSLTIAVDALDASSAVLAHGTTGLLMLTPDKTTSVDVLLAPSTGAVDASATYDAGGDLTMDASVDDQLPEPPDLEEPACPDDAFCDNFEEGLNTTVWAKQPISATTAVDTTHAHRGYNALHLHWDAIGGDSFSTAVISSSHPFTIARPSFWVRAFFWAASPTSADAVELFGVLQGTPGFKTAGLEIDQQDFVLNDGIAVPAQSVTTPTLLPTDTWACVEWHIVIGDPGTLSMALDGVDLPQVVSADTKTGGPLASFTLGGNDQTAIGNSEIAHDMWIDDLVVSNTRIGCN